MKSFLMSICLIFVVAAPSPLGFVLTIIQLNQHGTIGVVVAVSFILNSKSIINLYIY
jgi:hypothetical protein